MIAEAIDLSSGTLAVGVVAEGVITWEALAGMVAVLAVVLPLALHAGRKSGESSGQQQAIDFQRQLVELKFQASDSALKRIGDDVGEVRRAQAKAEKAAQEHRHDDSDRFQEVGLWRQWIEGVLAQHGLITNVRDTGPHPSVHERRNTPRPRSPEDTGPGESR